MSSRVLKRTAQSSAKSEEKRLKASVPPLLRSHFSPVTSPASRVWNCGLSTGQSMVSRAACMMNRNRAGPSESQAPCLTPMLLGTLVSVLPTLNFMLVPVCNRTTMLMKCSGSPNFLRISHSAVRLTVSNAFTRSTKRA